MITEMAGNHKELLTQVEMLILIAPFIERKLMDELVAQGHSILMVSSEMVELMGMADRIIVLANHRKAGELTKEQFSQEAILTLASDETPKAV